MVLANLGSNQHIVSSYEKELDELDAFIAQMGGQAEHLLGRAFDALERRDEALAREVIKSDKKIDEFESDIEAKSIAMIALRQPMGNDLRRIVTAIRVSADLERIGDLGKNIAKRALAVAAEKRPKTIMVGLKHMVELSLNQLKDVLDAYSQRDAEKAVEVWRDDEEIDAVFNSLFRELLTYMMEDPRNIGLCTHLLFAAKNIERIGDHATNIAETVYYLVHGTKLADERPKSDITSQTMPDGEA